MSLLWFLVRVKIVFQYNWTAIVGFTNFWDFSLINFYLEIRKLKFLITNLRGYEFGKYLFRDIQYKRIRDFVLRTLRRVK